MAKKFSRSLIRPFIAAAILAVICSVLLSFCLPAASNDKQKNIAILLSRNIAPYNFAIESFKQGLKEKGIDFVSVTYDLDGTLEEGHRVMKIIAESQCDLILAVGSTATEVAFNEGKACPVLFTMALYPEDSGFVSAKDRSMNLLTGVSLDISPEKQFEALKALMPGVKRIGVIYYPPETKRVVETAKSDAAKMGIELVPVEIYSESKVPDALGELVGRVDALWSVADSAVASGRSVNYMITFSLRNKIPLIGVSSYFVREGALISLTPDYSDVGAQSSELAAKLLGGAAVKNIPFERPRKAVLSINLRTAKRMGIKISDAIISEAGEVVR